MLASKFTFEASILGTTSVLRFAQLNSLEIETQYVTYFGYLSHKSRF
jgi:hypothetical protein